MMSMDKTEFLELAARVEKLEEGQKTLRGVYSDALVSKMTANDTRLRRLTRMAIDLAIRLKAIEEELKTKVTPDPSKPCSCDHAEIERAAIHDYLIGLTNMIVLSDLDVSMKQPFIEFIDARISEYKNARTGGNR